MLVVSVSVNKNTYNHDWGNVLLILCLALFVCVCVYPGVSVKKDKGNWIVIFDFYLFLAQ